MNSPDVASITSIANLYGVPALEADIPAGREIPLTSTIQTGMSGDHNSGLDHSCLDSKSCSYDRNVVRQQVHFGVVERHIAERDGRRLCDGKPASRRDISSEDWMELREAWIAATLCPDCQGKLHQLDVQLELYGMGRHSSAHLYAVPVLAGFDAIRNCSHCRRNTDDDCSAWRKTRKAVAVLRKQATRMACGLDELRHATGGCTVTVYEFAGGSVAYFAPDAPDFAEAGELKGADLAAVLRILDERGMPGGMAA